ncbi:hypothetical protein BGAL_0672g00020 [Botrytis galanthina]|uniref:Uncharacterized protein n=1 Tax=Botrytis galanthina TaxID=278940 RepID=A0A4S8QKF0_9HELO|nr:hypothetical protein BGAL_0672g00020 [Botrytis galanthina]
MAGAEEKKAKDKEYCTNTSVDGKVNAPLSRKTSHFIRHRLFPCHHASEKEDENFRNNLSESGDVDVKMRDQSNFRANIQEKPNNFAKLELVSACWRARSSCPLFVVPAVDRILQLKNIGKRTSGTVSRSSGKRLDDSLM